MKDMNNDIIVAMATPYGKSAVAIIRISGDGCIDAVARHLKKKPMPGVMALNEFTTEKFKENLMCVCFKAPKSFTGEDTVELYPHGNMVICDGIIKQLLDSGMRLAERGEFTKRAFMNGKIDLMQCEALADIIDAQTAEQLVYGNKRYGGDFKALDSVEKLLNRALSTVEAVLHYSDELEGGEAENAVLNDVYSGLDEVIKKLENEVSGYDGGRIVNDGFKVALIGAPNVGKSTLLNALSDSDSAIVTPIAGTTRDIITASYVYNGKKFTVLDTAGIKSSTDDEVEKIGIERAKKAESEADAVVYVTAGGKKAETAKNAALCVEIENKRDETADVGQDYARATTGGILAVSAKNGKNITALKQKLFDIAPKDCGSICNHRQYSCVLRCLDSCRAAKLESDKAGGLEIVAALLYEAYSAIQDLYGTHVDEKIIQSVFERFCVGK